MTIPISIETVRRRISYFVYNKICRKFWEMRKGK